MKPNSTWYANSQRIRILMMSVISGHGLYLMRVTYDSIFSHTYNLMALEPNPPCQHSLWKETGVPGENPRLSPER